MKILKKVMIVLGSLFILAVVLWWSFRDPVVSVDSSKIRRGQFVKSISEEGVTRLQNDFLVSTPGDGILPQIKLEVGDEVRKNQVLFVFDSDISLPVKSPDDGVILEVLQKDRKHIQRGVPVLRIGQPKALEVVSEVLTEQAVQIKPKQKVLIKKWGQDFDLEGEVEKVEPLGHEKISALGVSEHRVNVVIKILTSPEKWKSLSAGYKVQVEIELEKISDGLLISTGALFQKPDGFYAYKVDHQKARLIHIPVQDRSPDWALLQEKELSGVLSIDDLVILYPSPQVLEGTRVKVRSLVE